MSDIAFHEPTSLDEVVALLGADADARCLAGGQTLVAMMNAELIAPSALISLASVRELSGIDFLGDGVVRIGAMTTHADVAACGNLKGWNTVVREAAAQIAHPAIRNFGTIGGAVAHGDPAADYPAALVAADARIHVLGANGSRNLSAVDLFVDFLTTSLVPGELITGIELETTSPQSGGTYLKFARVDGDYATVSVAVALAGDDKGCHRARIAVGACGSIPIRSDDADAALVDGGLEDAAVDRAGRLLAEASDPLSDVRGSAEYKRMLIPRLVKRAVGKAAARMEAMT